MFVSIALSDVVVLGRVYAPQLSIFLYKISIDEIIGVLIGN